MLLIRSTLGVLRRDAIVDKREALKAYPDSARIAMKMQWKCNGMLFCHCIEILIEEVKFRDIVDT